MDLIECKLDQQKAPTYRNIDIDDKIRY